MQAPLPPLDRVDPQQAWQPWVSGGKDFGLKWAGHLYRRAGFGGTRDELQRAVADGLPATVERLLRGDPDRAEADRVIRESGALLVRPDNSDDLAGWWLYAMLHTGHPLREKMTLFWHNHFATSVAKVRQAGLMYKQNALFRDHALGKFHPLLLGVSQDPAMLIWLDSNSNVKGRPNENYAREVMELFSLGVGNYTEKDIREAARAFTGWHRNGDAFEFNALLHDDGPKTVLGRSGNLDGGDVIRIVLEQPAAARFLVRKLYRAFVNEAADPPAALLEPLAAALRAADYDISAPVRLILGSRHFFSDYAYRQRVKSPVEYAVGAARATGASVTPRTLAAAVAEMGQKLFSPPNVKGWDGGRAWLNTATILARHNFAQSLPPVAHHPAEAKEAAKAVDQLLDTLLQGDVAPATRPRLVAFLTEGNPSGPNFTNRLREVSHAILTTPEYQLA